MTKEERKNYSPIILPRQLKDRLKAYAKSKKLKLAGCLELVIEDFLKGKKF